jgi:basic membrane lipoprotein Med (substrate-binding protein (PBP1-ABC) superfamily)
MKKKYIYFFVLIILVTILNSSCTNNQAINKSPEFTLVVIDNEPESDDTTTKIDFKSQLIKSFEKLSKKNDISSEYVHLHSKNKNKAFSYLHKSITELLIKKTKVLFIYNFSEELNGVSTELIKTLSEQYPQTTFITNLFSEDFQSNIVSTVCNVDYAGISLGYLTAYYIDRQNAKEIPLSRSRTNPESLMSDLYDNEEKDNSIKSNDIKIAFFDNSETTKTSWYDSFIKGVTGYNELYLKNNIKVERFELSKRFNFEQVSKIAQNAIKNGVEYFVISADYHSEDLLKICKDRRIKVIGTDLDFYFHYPLYQELVVISGIKDIEKMFTDIFANIIEGNELPKMIKADSENNYVTVSEINSFNFEMTEKIRNEIKSISQ